MSHHRPGRYPTSSSSLGTSTSPSNTRPSPAVPARPQMLTPTATLSTMGIAPNPTSSYTSASSATPAYSSSSSTPRTKAYTTGNAEATVSAAQWMRSSPGFSSSKTSASPLNSNAPAFPQSPSSTPFSSPSLSHPSNSTSSPRHKYPPPAAKNSTREIVRVPSQAAEARVTNILNRLDLSLDDLDPEGNKKLSTQIMKSFLNKWLLAYKNKVRKNRHLITKVADLLYKRRLRIFWGYFRSIFLASRQLRLRGCRIALSVWTRAHDLRNYFAMKLRMSDKYHNLILERKCISKWFRFVRRKSALLKYARIMHTWRSKRIFQALKSSFVAWKFALKRSKNVVEVDQKSSERRIKIKSLLDRVNSAASGGNSSEAKDVNMNSMNRNTYKHSESKSDFSSNNKNSHINNPRHHHDDKIQATTPPTTTTTTTSKSSMNSESYYKERDDEPQVLRHSGYTRDSSGMGRIDRTNNSNNDNNGYSGRVIASMDRILEADIKEDRDDWDDPPPPYDAIDGSFVNQNNSPAYFNSKSHQQQQQEEEAGNLLGEAAHLAASLNINQGKPPLPTASRKLEELEMRAKERKAKMMELKDKSKTIIQKKTNEDAEMQRKREQEEYSAFLKAQGEKQAEVDKLKRRNAKYLDQFKQQNQQRIETNNTLQVANSNSQLAEKLAKAKRYYDRMLLLKYGWSPLIKLVDNARLHLLRCHKFRIFKLTSSSFFEWYAFTDASRRERFRYHARQDALAQKFYRRATLRKVWKGWALYRKFLRAKANSVSGHFSKYVIRKTAFKAWLVALQRSQRMEAHKLQRAAPIGNLAVKRHSWAKWVVYLSERRLEREVNHRSAAVWQNLQSYMKNDI